MKNACRQMTGKTYLGDGGRDGDGGEFEIVWFKIAWNLS